MMFTSNNFLYISFCNCANCVYYRTHNIINYLCFSMIRNLQSVASLIVYGAIIRGVT